MYGRLKTKETDETVCYMQEFKISCADEEYSNVLEFLCADEYRIRNIFLKDTDVTIDYSRSFDKDEVIHHLTTKKGFRMQGCTIDADRTIRDNTDQVGNNCLTYIETVQPGVKFTRWCRCWRIRAFEKPLVNIGRTAYARRILVWPKLGVSPKIVV